MNPRRSGRSQDLRDFDLIFAQRAFAAARILARPAALILLFLRGLPLTVEIRSTLKIFPSRFSRESILARTEAARLSCLALKFLSRFVVIAESYRNDPPMSRQPCSNPRIHNEEFLPNLHFVERFSSRHPYKPLSLFACSRKWPRSLSHGE